MGKRRGSASHLAPDALSAFCFPNGNSHSPPRRRRNRTTTASTSTSTSYLSSNHANRDAERKKQMEQTRRARMDRLRAENEEEEKKMNALDLLASKRSTGGLDGTTSSARMGRIGDEMESSGQTGFIKMNEKELEGMDEDEQMMKLLGFSGNFASTKGAHVKDNSNTAARGAVSKNKARKYRQYMNRKGGFNRPLDKMN